MPTPLSINDIQQLQARLASGDIQGVYTFLLDQGYNYAGWARGVAAGNTIAGEAALDYMKGTALMGVGGLPGQSLSADTIQGIKFDMAKSYLETLSNIADAPENNGYVNRDINAKEVWGFHAKVFRKYNLSIDNWTLNAPFKILQKLGGDAALEEYWAFMRDTKGADSYDTTVANLGTLAFMHKQAASSDPEISSMAQAWMQNVPGIYNGDQVIQSIKLALPFLERQLASSPTPAGLMLRLSILGETLAVPLADKIALSLSSAFNSAQRLSIRRDPLVLDLDGDGLETLGPTQSNVLFDHDADGIKTATGWVKPDDGFLVMDRNNNGVIDNGRELFGDATPLYAGGTAADGFAALAQEDTNGDGRVDHLDANWSKLRVWRDLNQDGVSQSNELLTMGNAGIAGFNVARTINSATLANGNQVADLGMYIKTDGATGTLGGAGQMADVNLAQDSFHSQFTDQIPIDEDVAPLPGMPGSGLVRELRQAASLDTAAGNALKTKLAAFANAQSSAEQQALINDVLLAWADTSPLIATMQNRNPQQVNVVWSSAAQQAEWEGKLHILEAFNGRYFFALPGDTQPGAASGLTLSAPDAQGKRTATVTLFADQVSRLQQSFDTLKASVYGSLVLQTRLKPLLDKIQVGIDNDGAHLDFSQLDSELNARVASNAVNGVADWIDLAKYGQSTFAGTGYDAWGTLKTALFSGAIAADTLNALHIQVGTAGNDTVTGAATDNLLFAGAGDDKLYGNNGADVLAGGAGNDVLYGGIGSDTYLFNLGDGQDTIQENANEGLDLLRLGVGLDAASTQIVRENMDLVLVFNANDKVRISNYFNGNSVDLIGFADGTVWDYTAVAEKVIYTGTANADYLYGVNDVANRIYGLDGNDQIYGGTNSDRLDGGAGNDYLESGSGNDTLTGGTGSDTLVS